MDVDQTEYFSSYEDLEIHKLMLEDVSRTEAYKNAIFRNKAYFKDKVVMDVGCGTGILSIFCAQAGAKKVYGVEASNLANIAKEIVKENNFENVVEIIHNKVEDVILPDNVKVDAIVSEWMGFYLLHEGMLDSVLIARNKFLKDDGEMFPSSAALYVAPCSVPSLYNKWSDVYGVSMREFAKHLRSEKYSKPDIIHVTPDNLLADPETICWVNLKEDELSDLDSFNLQHVVGASKSGDYQGLCLWFDCIFPNLSGEGDESHIKLGTGPMDAPTHWKQTVIVLPNEQEVDVDEPIAYNLELTRSPNSSRRYNLQVTMLDPESVEHPLPCSCYLTKCILIKTFMLQNTGNMDANGVEDDELSEEDS